MYAITYPANILSVSLFCPHGIKNEMEDAELREYCRLRSNHNYFPETYEQFHDCVYELLCYNQSKLPRVIRQGLFVLRKEKNKMHLKGKISLGSY